MTIIGWVIKFFIFVLLLGLALGNTEPTTVGFFGEARWQITAPQIVFLLIFFGAGLLLGVLSMTPRVVGARREASRQRKDADRARRVLEDERAEAAPSAEVMAAMRPPVSTSVALPGVGGAQAVRLPSA